MITSPQSGWLQISLGIGNNGLVFLTTSASQHSQWRQHKPQALCGLPYCHVWKDTWIQKQGCWFSVPLMAERSHSLSHLFFASSRLLSNSNNKKKRMSWDLVYYQDTYSGLLLVTETWLILGVLRAAQPTAATETRIPVRSMEVVHVFNVNKSFCTNTVIIGDMCSPALECSPLSPAAGILMVTTVLLQPDTDANLGLS